MACVSFQLRQELRLVEACGKMRAASLRLQSKSAETQSPEEVAKAVAEKSAAEIAFRFDLIDRFAGGKLDHVDLGTIAWKTTQAGAGGVSDLAVDPTHKRHHAEKNRSALNLNMVKDEILYSIKLPQWDASSAARVVGDMFVKLPHECLARDFHNNRAAYLKARSDPDDLETTAFLEHPVILEFGKDACWSCGYYTDKVKFGNESFYRGSVKCTVMRSSTTCWVFKCSAICRCGCNGACTIDALQMEMNWSLNALQEDTFMKSRFDKRPWLPTESSREKRAGVRIGFRGVVNEYRADLPERCAAARVKNQGGQYGCLSCLEQSNRIHDRVTEVTLLSTPWVPRTQDNHLDELYTHLVSVDVCDTVERSELAAALEWPDRYPWGRRVKGAQGSRWGLAANDQLIISDDLRNPHDLESLHPPFKVFFFRPRKASSAVGVSLMFNVPGVHALGINHFEVVHFCEDTHTLDLGVAQRFCATAMVTGLRLNIYKLPGPKSKLLRRGCIRMAKDIKQYYKDEGRRNPWKKLSQLSKTFSFKDLGQLSKPCLKAKGGQTRCLVKFCTGLMQKYDCGPNGKLLARAGVALMEAYDIMHLEPRRMSFKARQGLLVAMINHVVCYQAAGGHLVYKHHGAIHLALMAGWFGNPRHVSTYEDEHENGVLAKIGLRVHGSTFAKSIFERFELHNPQRRPLSILV